MNTISRRDLFRSMLGRRAEPAAPLIAVPVREEAPPLAPFWIASASPTKAHSAPSARNLPGKRRDHRRARKTLREPGSLYWLQDLP